LLSITTFALLLSITTFALLLSINHVCTVVVHQPRLHCCCPSTTFVLLLCINHVCTVVVHNHVCTVVVHQPRLHCYCPPISRKQRSIKCTHSDCWWKNCVGRGPKQHSII
jgi:hypothetical protein